MKDRGVPPRPKELAAKKAALKEAAFSSDPALIKELHASDDAKSLQRAAEALAPEGDSAALDAANKRISEHCSAKATTPATGLQTHSYSLDPTHPTLPADAGIRAAVEQHIKNVLGPKIKVIWENILHAGSFTLEKGKELIRLSVHPLRQP